LRLRTSGDAGDHDGRNARGSSHFGKGKDVAIRVTRTSRSDVDCGDIARAICVDSSGGGGASATSDGDGGSCL
jgi:hypothetical protein